MAKMAETMSRMGDMWGRIATKRDCVDSSPLPFQPKRNRLDDDADSEAEMASLMRPLNPTESAMQNYKLFMQQSCQVFGLHNTSLRIIAQI